MWGEASITIAVTENPPQFVKVAFGHERTCRETEEAISRTERLIDKMNKEVVERRASELQRLIKRVAAN